VALAARSEAEACEITPTWTASTPTDPRICERAHKLDRISYEEMLELASLGSKVLRSAAWNSP